MKNIHIVLNGRQLRVVSRAFSISVLVAAAAVILWWAL